MKKVSLTEREKRALAVALVGNTLNGYDLIEKEYRRTTGLKKKWSTITSECRQRRFPKELSRAKKRHLRQLISEWLASEKFLHGVRKKYQF